MHAVIRSYSGSGASQLFDLLEQRKPDVESNMQSIPGLVSYFLIRTADGGASVTVCQDQASADEGARRAREWIAANAPQLAGSAPRVIEGSVIVQSGAMARELAGSLGA